MQLPITIGLHRSFLGLAGLAAIHGSAVVALVPAPWPVWFKGAIVASLAASLVFSWRRRKPRVEALRLFGDGRVECRLVGGGEFLSAELLPGATVHPWLTVIRLKTAGDTVATAIFPYSIAAEDFRRLRVWLRWRADFSAGGGAA